MIMKNPADAKDSPWPLRSILFTPASKPEWVKKAIASGAHGVILDLEDAVPHAAKAQARGFIEGELAELRASGVAGLVRINPLGEGGEEDLAASVRPGLHALVVPKLDSVEQVREVHDRLSHAEGRAGLDHGSIAILALPETAQGLHDAHQLARSSPRVCGFMTSCAGPVSSDVARAFGFTATLEGREQVYVQSHIILASRAAGARFPVGAVFGVRLDDVETVTMLVRRAKQMGFSGAVVMHPSHVAIANSIFQPSAEEVDYSRGLIEALEAAQKQGVGAITYRGMMVDEAMLPLAREVVAQARRRLP